MHDSIKQMLKKYNCQTQQDYLNAIKEIFQEIALLGLWRAKFFEKAAFYGGSALRILYGLNRFSEDLDFSLLKKNNNFSLDPYNKAIIKELAAFGFDASVQIKIKQLATNIKSAFIKTESKKQLIIIEAPHNIIKSMHHMQLIKIKMEIDTDPPGAFNTETKFLTTPIPFAVKSFAEPDLFAGKIHAILCRPWVARVKGRDWYDLVWYISRNVPINLVHLKNRLIQSKHWNKHDKLDKNALIKLLVQKIQATDFEMAKKDILLFIGDHSSIAVWSKQFFEEITKKIRATPTSHDTA